MAVSSAAIVTFFGISFIAPSFGCVAFLTLISCSCWELSTIADFLTGYDSETGAGRTPPELDEDWVRSNTGVEVGANTGWSIDPCDTFRLIGLNFEMECRDDFSFVSVGVQRRFSD